MRAPAGLSPRQEPAHKMSRTPMGTPRVRVARGFSVSFDASLVMYTNRTIKPPRKIKNKM
jgi:hypothetical protein